MLGNNRGTALITVLAAAFIVSLLLLSMSTTAVSVYRRIGGEMNKKQAYYTALSGIEVMEDISRGEDRFGESFDTEPEVRVALKRLIRESAMESGAAVSKEAEIDLPGGRCKIYIESTRDVHAAPIKGGGLTFTAETEAGNYLDGYGRAVTLPDGKYRLASKMRWEIDDGMTEENLWVYTEGFSEIDIGIGIYSDVTRFFWLLPDALTVADDVNPLQDYANPAAGELFILVPQGASGALLGGVKWAHSLEYVYIFTEAGGPINITGLSGLLYSDNPGDTAELEGGAAYRFEISKFRGSDPFDSNWYNDRDIKIAREDFFEVLTEFLYSNGLGDIIGVFISEGQRFTP